MTTFNKNFIDFYFEDIITEDLWIVFYRLGKNKRNAVLDKE